MRKVVTKEEILNVIKKHIEEIGEKNVTNDQLRLWTFWDLGCDNMDVIVIISYLIDEFKADISDDDIFSVIGGHILLEDATPENIADVVILKLKNRTDIEVVE